MDLGDDTYCVVIEENQITRKGDVFPERNISSGMFPGLSHRGSTGIAGGFLRISTRVIQAEGDEHGRPVSVRCIIPGAVTSITAANSITTNFKVLCAFGIAHLCLGDANQVASQISGVGIIGKHFLPVKQSFDIGGVVRVTGDCMDVLFIFAGHFPFIACVIVAVNAFGKTADQYLFFPCFDDFCFKTGIGVLMRFIQEAADQNGFFLAACFDSFVTGIIVAVIFIFVSTDQKRLCCKFGH